ncbi:MAG TPA: 4-hydroxy-tetrahydrodipicolinate reductase [Sulfurovum sp.]|nr:MAG: 4-hydroxy-tetrahydrodipicolinate reductase [Sulfurovum sp. 35-42-20]OYY55093.1 MAG: 4-hydroxy-tetrahydrodipicolinate reductase [Sulfurovum sp. 28-43-6]OYZ26268.1 MAG: 4-hydroxy-tetrahydrodipicolinate reductase [Sulfurovum sp. 16-42-52]OYZ48074.1 MAG: 4-hydroxy-tetrahydrodipicolinate reductase [Sulfurovum sp. 24-42-9]OZA46554.1 MAG: 4-hydroxy-tetrahydrodipicolinate reductase [Sulfurovum sp. 17-42-90]OZA60822.1 MAG: 4-hydroxy-tetrahydrodipicolinate reductase [Sulfurovum sp. 39-42-12]HQR
MARVGIVGSTGRVGNLLIDSLLEDTELTLSTVHVYGELKRALPSDVLVTNSMKALLENCEVVIDFSAPEATQELCEAALKNPTALVIATTGFTAHQQNLLKEASQEMPVLYASNMSAGIALLKQLVEKVAATLKDFDIEIVEQHHRHKVDAPSGTALTLGEFAAKGRGLDLDAVRVSGRDGQIGARSKDEIAVMALRGGDIVGRHTVGFYNDGEFLELNHTATSRETFSKGAIRAAKWLINQESGFYSINDCLGI